LSIIIVYIISAGAPFEDVADTVLNEFRGWIRCCDSSVKEKGYVLGLGVYDKGDVKDNVSMQEAYELGKNI